MAEQYDTVLSKLLASKNYRDVCPETVRRVWNECRGRYKKVKDAEKAAREALHGISGAFMTPQEARQLDENMQIWHTEHTDVGMEKMLSHHASTRERLPLAEMDALYQRIFTLTGKPRSVLDLACGINPLYLGARGLVQQIGQFIYLTANLIAIEQLLGRDFLGLDDIATLLVLIHGGKIQFGEQDPLGLDCHAE